MQKWSWDHWDCSCLNSPHSVSVHPRRNKTTFISYGSVLSSVFCGGFVQRSTVGWLSAWRCSKKEEERYEKLRIVRNLSECTFGPSLQTNVEWSHPWYSFLHVNCTTKRSNIDCFRAQLHFFFGQYMRSDHPSVNLVGPEMQAGVMVEDNLGCSIWY